MSRHDSPKRRRGLKADERPAQLGQCLASGKRRWASRDAARAHVRALRAAGGRNVAELHCYLCPNCDAWHVGHR